MNSAGAGVSEELTVFQMSVVGYTTLRVTRVFPSFGALCFDLAGGFFDDDFFRAAHRAWSERLSGSIHSASSFLLSSPPKPL